MMKGNIVIGLVIGVLLGGLIGWSVEKGRLQGKISSNPGVMEMSSKKSDLKMAMRKLWEDHITWTRMYLISAAYKNPDTKEVAGRLLKNQEDLGNAIKPIYGDAAGSKLTELLKTHITTAVDLVNAAAAGDKAALEKANTAWYANADQIATFLADANPNWPKADLTKMMHDHLDLTKQEAVDILGKNAEAGIVSYDKVHDEILMMSDALSDGVIKQFPDKF